MRQLVISTFCILLFCIPAGNAESQPLKKIAKATVELNFKHLVHGQPLVLDDSSYTNPFGEQYTVHKLKYYVSNFRFYSKGKATFLPGQYFLVNQSIDSSCSIKLQLPPGGYDSLQLMIGVDSAINTAGAQTGALDPLNDMYWTWQSGYIMQKLEGRSPQSSVVNNKMEYHLGGYGGANSAQRLVTINFAGQSLNVQPGGTNNITIKAELDRFWRGQSKISIKETPVCSSAGELAKQLSYNFAGMFSFEPVTQK